MILAKSNNGWELHTIENGRLSCEHFNLTPDDIERIEKILQPEFENSMKNEQIIISYDNWSGVFIMQMSRDKTYSSDDVIKKIYDFLSNSDLCE